MKPLCRMVVGIEHPVGPLSSCNAVGGGGGAVACRGCHSCDLASANPQVLHDPQPFPHQLAQSIPERLRPATPPPLEPVATAVTAAAFTSVQLRGTALVAPSAASQLPLELLALVLELVLADDVAQQRRHVIQFVSKLWLAAYRSVAYRRVCLHVGAALRHLQHQRELCEGAATAALLQGLAVRLPHAAEVVLSGIPPPPPAAQHSTHQQQHMQQRQPWGQPYAASQQHLRWQLGELLLAALGGSCRLRQLFVDYLPHLPLLLTSRVHAAAPPLGLPGLERLGVTALPATELLRHLPLLQRMPVHLLAICDAACLSNEESTALAHALSSLPHLFSLSLGGSAAARQAHVVAAAAGNHMPPAATDHPAGQLPPLEPMHQHPHSPQRPVGVCLPSLELVAAAAGLPALQQLELSLTFSKQQSTVQQQYLHQLGAVLHQERRQREAKGAAATDGACSCASAPDSRAHPHLPSCACAGSHGSRVSVTVHEHVQGDLSAVPVASCSLNLDWDDDSNPIEVWQCSTLRRLRIAAQLPLQAGLFRPARLAALQVLDVAGCCYIPAYFAEALCSMQQLYRLALSDCQLEAVAGVPWQQVLPSLPSLQEVAVERCCGAALLPTLWVGLAGCSQLRSLRITGVSAGGGLPPATALNLVQMLPAAVAAAAGAPVGNTMLGWQHLLVPLPPASAPFPAGFTFGQGGATCASPATSCGIPDCIALLQQLRLLDLSHNGLHSVPDSLSWCQQLTSVALRGNRLQATPRGVAALGGLRKLDLSCNQLTWLEDGPYLRHLEELLLGSNLPLLPNKLPATLLHARRLRRLDLPLWWQLAGTTQLDDVLLAHMPWLVLERS